MLYNTNQISSGSINIFHLIILAKIMRLIQNTMLLLFYISQANLIIFFYTYPLKHSFMSEWIINSLEFQ